MADAAGLQFVDRPGELGGARPFTVGEDARPFAEFAERVADVRLDRLEKGGAGGEAAQGAPDGS